MIIVNPNHRNPSPQAAIEPPIWCAYLAAYYGADSILDAELEGLTLNETLEAIGDEPCVLVAMGANPSASSTPKAGIALELEAHLPSSKVVGLHFGNMPDVRDLSPAWGLVDFSRYKAHNWHCLGGRDRSGYGVVYSSFGCPFNCYYCNISSLYSGITFRKPQDVVDEIDYLVSMGVKNLKFCDELFALNKTHVLDICDGIKDYKLNIWAYARADTITPALLAKMKEAGFNWLAYGFESASLGKGSPREAVDMTHNAGINVLGNFMFGLPEDDMESMGDTFDMAQDLQCEWANFYCTMAYPGSELYEDTTGKDLPDRWEDYDQYSPTVKPLPTRYLTSEEILRFRDDAFKAYFGNPEYQEMIRGRFGEQAAHHIREMLEWSPRRSQYACCK